MPRNPNNSHDDARRQNANWQEALRINEEIDKQSSEAGPSGNLGFICFVATILFLKPVVEYFISLAGAISGQIQALLIFLGL